MNEDEDFEEDENAIASYDAAFEVYLNQHKYSVTTFW